MRLNLFREVKAMNERTWMRSFSRRAVWVLALAGVMCACKGPATQEARSQAEVVSADTAKTSPGGTAFKVPAGWSMETGKNVVVLTPPETDSHVAIFDAGEAADAKAAAAAAWVA